VGHGSPEIGARTFGIEVKCISHPTTVQGKPVVRLGRKARDLDQTSRPPGCRQLNAGFLSEVRIVKANLARFTMALMILASVALSLGAGIKWS
jgi:hypothetical protein